MKLEEMRVKDLPEILKSLCAKVDDDIAENYSATYYLDKIDWTKATDQERLAYCELRYKEGDRFKCAHFSGIGFVEFYKTNCQGWVYCCGGSFPNEARYVYADGKFAEIIQPEEKPVESVEFKEGEMVEVTYYDHRDSWWRAKYVGFWKGRHWLKSMDDAHLRACEQIRKLDPDAEIKKMAEELLAKYGWNKIAIDYSRVKETLIEMAKKVKEGNL